MALVPYRVSGPAADQRSDMRLLQLPGGITLRLAQRPGPGTSTPSAGARTSGVAAASPTPGAASAGGGGGAGGAAVAAGGGDAMEWSGPPLSSLSNVGLVVWQAGFLLADHLLRLPPFGDPWADPAAAWRPLTAVDLGTGCGVVGIALAAAGARVFLTDLPHVLPLAEANLASNCDPRVCRATVCAYRWGDDPAVATAAAAPPAWDGAVGCAAAAPPAPAAAHPLAGVAPDLITAADVLYHPDLLPQVMAAIDRLSVPHTLSYVSYRVRHGGEVAAFAALAEAAGFAVEEVPRWQLHEEYGGACAAGAGRGGDGSGSGADAVMGDAASDGEGEDAGGDAAGGSSDGVDAAAGIYRCRPQGSYGILRLCRRDAGAAGAVGNAPAGGGDAVAAGGSARAGV